MLPFETGSFDLVVCIGVIQLIENYQPVLAELSRVTSPGGTLLVQTLHKGSLQRKLLGLVERSKKFDKMYGMAELADEFSRLGFDDISFLKQYHPLSVVSHTNAISLLTDSFCTSFALRGSKKNG